jgi:FkbM family methyltransferase
MARTVVPRPVRNWLRSPRQAFRWLANDLRGPIAFALRPDWTFRCPRNAAERAFHLQQQDPPQVQEFDDFVAYVRSTGRIVLLDIGCHFGVFCFAAIHYGSDGSKALGVDPSSEAHVMVERISLLNGWEERIQFVHAAAGAANGEIEMVETGLTGAGYVVRPRDHPQADRRRLPLLTVDTLAERLGEPPNLVKIDVESFEGEVLQGGQRTFAERGTPLFLEIHSRMMRERGVDPQAVLDQLRAWDYRSFQIGGREIEPAEMLGDEIVRVLVRRNA